jgi:murein L,D-transpeptidase YafK
MRVTETIIMPIKKKYNTYVPVNPDTINKDSVYLVINKSDYTLQVRYRKKVLRSYKATFGPNPQENKCMEGDRCTPEGWFRISGYNPRSKYHRFLRINYPNDSTYIRFKYLKEKGIIPMHARIGGDIGIHGVWQGGDDLIELGVGWTDGCIALKNKDIEELCSLVGIGTRVYIGK